MNCKHLRCSSPEELTGRKGKTEHFDDFLKQSKAEWQSQEKSRIKTKDTQVFWVQLLPPAELLGMRNTSKRNRNANVSRELFLNTIKQKSHKKEYESTLKDVNYSSTSEDSYSFFSTQSFQPLLPFLFGERLHGQSSARPGRHQECSR